MTWTWDLNPVAFSLLGLDVRWYGIAYLLGFFVALHIGYLLHQKITSQPLPKKEFENIIFGTFLGGVLGGRIGFFLFYDFQTILESPLELLKIWQGGMSIHGGIIGAVFFLFYWSKKHKHSLLELFDTLVLPLSIALVFGRLANFINGELVGRVTDQTWGVIFPHVDSKLRHPSQLYEMAKNTANTIILWYGISKEWYKYPGLLSALFCFGYGIQRFGIEYFREPEIVIATLSMGQWLCLGLIIVGVFLFKNSKKI